MKPPKCKFCGVMEWRHICASNSASNIEVASNNASNAKDLDRRAEAVSIKEGVSGISGGVETNKGVARKQRWSREAYNAYQREYMRRRRHVR